jgi:hypothetical protein
MKPFEVPAAVLSSRQTVILYELIGQTEADLRIFSLY